MKVVVYKLPGQDGWYIKLVTNVGVTAGKTRYESKEAAEAAARAQYPNVAIEIEE